jgi:glycosyltransferase involved in cell wall biosynthesis
MPLVSVIIPAHNSVATVARAIRSAAAQTYRNIEIIVVDDASSDATADVARRAAAEYPTIAFSLLKTSGQSGAGAARNAGIAAARGEFVAFLDADDEWFPEKTAQQLTILGEQPNLGFVTCEAERVTANGTRAGLINSNRPRAHGEEAWKTLLKHPCVATTCVIARRSKIDAVGGFDASLRIAEDQDLWIRLALEAPVYSMSRVLVQVHEQSTGLSETNPDGIYTITLPMVMGHLQRLKGRLSPEEAREIRCERRYVAGRGSYERGHALRGLWLLLSTALEGYQTARILGYVISAAPPVRSLKKTAAIAAAGFKRRQLGL